MMTPALVALGMASIAAAGFSSPGDPGPFQFEVTQVRVPFGRAGMAAIFYRPLVPESVPGSRPVVIFGHGFLGAARRYGVIYRHLAAHGFYVLAPQYPDPIFGRPNSLPTDGMFATIEFLDSLSRIPGNRLDPRRVGLVGHSMGGGAAFLAARRDRLGRVKAIAGLSPWGPANTTAESLRIPTLVIAAENDGSTPVENVRREFFDPAPGPCYFLLIRNGGHNGYLDHTCWIEDRFEKFDRVSQLRAVRTYLAAFLGFYLESDVRYGPWLFGAELARDTTVSFERK